MSYQDEILHLIHDLDSEFTLQPCFVSATAILLYDTLLTLEKEVNLIWERKFGAISVVYVVNRYVRLMACVLNIALWFPVHDETCHTLLILGSITNVVPYLAWAVFAGLRMHALSNRSIQLTAAVFLLTATFIIPYIFEYSNHASIVNAPYPYNCLLAPQPSRLTQPLLLATRATTILGESILLGWTIRAAVKSRISSSRRLRRARSLMTILLTNGVVCFSFPVVINVATVALTVVGSDAAVNLSGKLVAYRDPIIAVLISRFILSLRSLIVATLSADDGYCRELATHVPSRLTTVVPISGVQEVDTDAIKRWAGGVETMDEFGDADQTRHNASSSSLGSGIA